MDAGEYMTINEVGAELNRSASAVRNYINNHGLAAFRRGNLTFVRRADLATWKADADHIAMMQAGDRLYRTRRATPASA